jgi:hypothetical protein
MHVRQVLMQPPVGLQLCVKTALEWQVMFRVIHASARHACIALVLLLTLGYLQCLCVLFFWSLSVDAVVSSVPLQVVTVFERSSAAFGQHCQLCAAVLSSSCHAGLASC